MASVTRESGASTLLPSLGGGSSTAKPGGSGGSTLKTGEQTAEKPEFYWMVKPCFMYKEEYRDCRSFKARFHQYFIEGVTQDCQPWKQDHDNCVQWEEHKDADALQRVIQSEKGRVRKRLRAHYSNNVWEQRSSPPDDWNKPLPPSIQREYETSFLKQKAEELRSGKEKLGQFTGLPDEGLGVRGDEEEGSSCSIV